MESEDDFVVFIYGYMLTSKDGTALNFETSILSQLGVGGAGEINLPYDADEANEVCKNSVTDKLPCLIFELESVYASKFSEYPPELPSRPYFYEAKRGGVSEDGSKELVEVSSSSESDADAEFVLAAGLIAAGVALAVIVGFGLVHYGKCGGMEQWNRLKQRGGPNDLSF